MAEMILSCYAIGYAQVFLFWNFDEADQLRWKEMIGMVICTALYCLISYFCGWFDKQLLITALFAAYILLHIFACFIYTNQRERLMIKSLMKS